MGVLSVCAVVTFVYLAPLSYASDPLPEQFYVRARVASVECWFDPHCWAAAKPTGDYDAHMRRTETVSPPRSPPIQVQTSAETKTRGVAADSEKRAKKSRSRKRASEAPLACVDDDRLLSTAVGKPISCFVVKEADMCDVLIGTPAEKACGCSCG